MLARLLASVTALLTLPPRLAHEATHAVLTAPHADNWHVSVGATRGYASVIVDDWNTDAPRWGIVLAHLGPLICGIILGIAGLVWVAIAGYVPQDTESWLKVAILATYWGIYTTPSGGDLAILSYETHPEEEVDDAAE